MWDKHLGKTKYVKINIKVIRTNKRENMTVVTRKGKIQIEKYRFIGGGAC